MTAEVSAVLSESQNPDGGWGYAPGGLSAVEATSLALVAASRHLPAGALLAGRDYLLAAQNDDGGWGMAADDDESGWHTAWAAIALSRLGTGDEAVDRAVSWLLAVRPCAYTAEDSDLWASVLKIDLTVTGWPWMPDQTSWVEPTALSLLALAQCGALPLARERVTGGVRYLVDRRCQGGGWNWGNPHMYVPFRAQAQATTWVLLALRQVSPADVTSEDLAALRSAARAEGTVLSLALATLALAVWDEPVQAELADLKRMLAADLAWRGNPYQAAVVLAALQGGL